VLQDHGDQQIHLAFLKSILHGGGEVAPTDMPFLKVRVDVGIYRIDQTSTVDAIDLDRVIDPAKQSIDIDAIGTQVDTKGGRGIWPVVISPLIGIGAASSLDDDGRCLGKEEVVLGIQASDASHQGQVGDLFGSLFLRECDHVSPQQLDLALLGLDEALTLDREWIAVPDLSLQVLDGLVGWRLGQQGKQPLDTLAV